jgi:hypothetical protein
MRVPFELHVNFRSDFTFLADFPAGEVLNAGAFPAPVFVGQSSMALRRLINLVLAACVTFGLALGPLVTPASAMAPSMPMGDMSAMSADMDMMSADMPCCPSEPKSQSCPDCQLMAICVMKTVQAGPSLAPAMVVRHAVRTSHLVMDDVVADGVVRPPPDHPPRA